MSASIDDLLNSLKNPFKGQKLENTKETWSRIANKDSFEELGLSGDDLENFLSSWREDNPYSNIV
jgi:hypothetical protein